MQSEPIALLSLRGLTERFKLPAAWLKAEALAGRIPSLRVGRRLLFNPEAVEHVLLERAAHVETHTRGAPHG
jgi:hypothetical protein